MVDLSVIVVDVVPNQAFKETKTKKYCAGSWQFRSSKNHVSSCEKNNNNEAQIVIEEL